MSYNHFQSDFLSILLDKGLSCYTSCMYIVYSKHVQLISSRIPQMGVPGIFYNEGNRLSKYASKNEVNKLSRKMMLLDFFIDLIAFKI
jgi:hypothetical protein